LCQLFKEYICSDMFLGIMEGIIPNALNVHTFDYVVRLI
jgi:hypothetical protein